MLLERKMRMRRLRRLLCAETADDVNTLGTTDTEVGSKGDNTLDLEGACGGGVREPKFGISDVRRAAEPLRTTKDLSTVGWQRSQPSS